MIDYRGYTIEPKRDFGPTGFHVGGKITKVGYVAVKGGCNAMPGATWFHTIESAKAAIAVLIDVGGEDVWNPAPGHSVQFWQRNAGCLVNYAKELDRKDLVLAVWAAEFTRAMGGLGGLGGHSPLVNDVMHLRRCAKMAAASADLAVETLRLLVDVEFRLATADELADGCYMSWAEFISCCETNAFTDDDGYGELATADHYISGIRVSPGVALHPDFSRPDWATHVCWYNK